MKHTEHTYPEIPADQISLLKDQIKGLDKEVANYYRAYDRVRLYSRRVDWLTAGATHKYYNNYEVSNIHISVIDKAIEIVRLMTDTFYQDSFNGLITTDCKCISNKKISLLKWQRQENITFNSESSYEANSADGFKECQTSVDNLSLKDGKHINHDEQVVQQSYELLAKFRKQIADLNKIANDLGEVIGSIEGSKGLPRPVTELDNFKRNNKLPAPDDEDIKRKKLPISIAQELANTIDITDREMAFILTISIRTYHRLKSKGLLNPVASERLLLLKELAAFGVEVFEDQSNFNKWLRLPISELGNISPLDSLDTATGFNHVRTVLERIEYGVYS